MIWTTWTFWAVLLGLFLLALGLRTAVRCKTPFHSTWTGMLGGVAALAAVNISGLLTQITVPVNALTAGWASITGVPGVIALLFAQILVQTSGI